MKEYTPHDILAVPEWKCFVRNPLNKANLHADIMFAFVKLN